MRTQEEYFGVPADERTQDDASEVQFVSFLLGEEEFGADILMAEAVESVSHFACAPISARMRMVLGKRPWASFLPQVDGVLCIAPLSRKVLSVTSIPAWR